MFVLPLVRPSHIARRDARISSFDRIVERFFDDSHDRFFGASKGDVATRTPAMDVAENASQYIVTFDVPGASRERLKVSVEGRRVTLTTSDAIAAAESAPADPKVEAAASVKAADRQLYRERSEAVYARTVSLPAEVDQSASEAKFEHGVLTLVLAKKVPAGATQLQIA